MIGTLAAYLALCFLAILLAIEILDLIGLVTLG